MSNSKISKIQFLLIKYLLDNGSIELILPDGVSLEIGITQENEQGEQEVVDDYCYVSACRDGKKTILDSYNLGLQFLNTKNTIVYEDEIMGEDGETIKCVDVI